MDLDNLKYSELQKLAKTAGIKANMKVEKLVKALKEHYTSQGQSDSNNHKADEDCSTQADAPKKDQSSANEDESAEKKGPSRGRKKGQKKGGRGKAKKTTDERREERTETQKTGTPQNGSTSSSLLSPKAKLQGTPGSKQAFISKKTPQAVTPNVSKTPAIVKPVSSKTLQNRKPEVKKTDLKLTPARTPGTGPKNTHTKVITGKNTPGLFSPRVPPPSQSSSVSTEKMTPKRSSSTGKKLTSSATKENEKSPSSGGVKRRSPRNQTTADENKQNEAKVSPVNSGSKRKRQSTFELEGPSLASTATPEAEKTMKRVRRSTGSEQQDKTTPSSPGIQDMIDSMGGEISSAERRKRLMSALDKKVESKVKSSPQTGPVTQIPRFAAFLAKKRQEQKKPITPGNKDWEKVHKKEFSKFDSIDVYLEKKRKRAEEMTASVKKARTVLHEVQEAVTKLKNKRTPSWGGKAADKPFKPTVISTKDMNLNFGATASSTKTPTQRKSTSSKPFKPTVTSTKDMNLNFSSLKTPVNQKKAAEKVTPAPSMQNEAQSARKSVGPNQMSVRKSLGVSSTRKSLSSTPFQFTGNLNMSEVKSTTKPVFDLKASLARPITWKPHTGKLKPMAESYVTKGKEPESSATKPASSRKDIFKSMVNRTQRTYSRHDRRVAAAVKRAEQKHDLQMKRRGITVSP